MKDGRNIRDERVEECVDVLLYIILCVSVSERERERQQLEFGVKSESAPN